MAPKGPSKAQENAPLRGSPAWASFTAGGLGCQGAETTFPDGPARALFPDGPAGTCAPSIKWRFIDARSVPGYRPCLAAIHLAADRIGHPFVAGRLQRGQYAQPGR